MKNLIFCLLIFSTAAYAQEAAKPGPAGSEAAATEKPQPQQNKYYPEILQTMKNLSVLLERWAEVPQPKMDALAPEMAAFNEKVKNTLGKEMLAEIARKEKELEDKARASSAIKTLQAFRAALQVSYATNGGVYPKTPALLIPSEMQEVPELYLPGHERTTKITVIDSKKHETDFNKAVTDSGGWLYFSNPASVNYGLLVLDCSHTDAVGMGFSKY